MSGLVAATLNLILPQEQEQEQEQPDETVDDEIHAVQIIHKQA